jgi:hypothetical protein
MYKSNCYTHVDAIRPGSRRIALHTVDDITHAEGKVHISPDHQVSVGSFPSDFSGGDGEIGNLTVMSRVCLFNLPSMVPRMIKLASFEW